MKSRTLVTKLVKFADFFTKADLVAMHQVLAIKYPITVDSLFEYTCDLKAVEGAHDIKRIESSKALYFIDYEAFGDVSFFGYNDFYPHIMTLSKKSLADGEKDIVLMRKKVRSMFSTRSNGDDIITIQSNTKYEIRLIFSSLAVEQKLCVPIRQQFVISETTKN